MKFQDLECFTDDDIQAALRRNDPDELQLVSITIALVSTDQAHAQTVCVKLCSHQNAKVRGNALISLGHLARRFRKLDETTVKPLLECALLDTDNFVQMNARSAADEIQQFLHWQITGHVYGSW